MGVDKVGYAYAAAVAAGGYLANKKTLGLTFGALLGYGAYLNSQSPPKPGFQLVTGIVLAGWMGIRYLHVGKSRVLVKVMNGKVVFPAFVCLLSCGILYWKFVN